MKRIAFVAGISLSVAACTADPQRNTVDAQPARDDKPPAAAAVKPATMSGEEAYAYACAECHDAGLNGAPVTRNRADWEGRSPLWQAVLMEHAKLGYFDMPPKGGHEELPDLTVSAAAEYMLEITFPDLPKD